MVNSNGINLDGESISKNFNTFWGMYETNTDVFKCVEVKQKMVMKKGFTLMRKNTTDDKMKLSKDPDFIKALGDVDALKNDIIQALEICADVFIRRRRNLLKEVIGYEVLDTREVSVVTDPLLKPLRYTYRRKTVASVTVETYPAEDIDHWKIGSNWNNVLFGLSPLRTLIYEVFGDLEAGMVNYYWYKNDAVPSSLYVLKEGLTPEEQANAIKDVQDTLKGSHNAGKSMVTNAITDVKTFQKDEQGSLDIEKRRYNTEKICAGLGVPRAVLNYIEGVNLANMDGMIKLFIENTIEPYERLIEKIFTSLSQDFQGLYFVINSDHLDQMEQKSKLYRENVA